MQAPTLPATVIVPPAVTADLRQHLVDQFPHDEARIDRACELVAAGAVEREPRPGRWLVVSRSRPNLAHHVDARRSWCTCEDFARQGPRGAACLHLYAVELYCYAERVEVDLDGVSVDEPIPFILTPEALEWLDGEAVDLPRQCSRCHAEAAILTHVDHYGARCLAGELFGPDPDAA